MCLFESLLHTYAQETSYPKSKSYGYSTFRTRLSPRLGGIRQLRGQEGVGACSPRVGGGSLNIHMDQNLKGNKKNSAISEVIVH